jgi:hypothetical protein
MCFSAATFLIQCTPRPAGALDIKDRGEIAGKATHLRDEAALS